MPYASPQAVRAVLARDPAKAAGTAASLSDTELTDRIGTASAQVDAHLGGAGYPVPWPEDTVPALLREITVAIAAYLADLTYRQSKDHSSVLDPVIQRYQWATGLLGQISRGQLTLPGAVSSGQTPGLHGADVVAVYRAYDGSLFGPEDVGLGAGPRPGADDWGW